MFNIAASGANRVHVTSGVDLFGGHVVKGLVRKARPPVALRVQRLLGIAFALPRCRAFVPTGEAV